MVLHISIPINKATYPLIRNEVAKVPLLTYLSDKNQCLQVHVQYTINRM